MTSPRWSRCSSPAADGLGLFIRSLVGLAHQAAVDVFGHCLDDDARFTVDQIRFVNLIVDELSVNDIMSPGRVFESPRTPTTHLKGLSTSLLRPRRRLDH